MALSVGSSVQMNGQGMPPGSHGAQHMHQRRAPASAGVAFAGNGSSGGPPPGQTAEQLAAWQRVLDEAQTEIINQASENEFLRSKVRVMEWQRQLHNNGAVDGEADIDSLDSRQSSAMAPSAELNMADATYAGHHGGKLPLGVRRPVFPQGERRRVQSGPASEGAASRPSDADGGPANAWLQDSSPPPTPNSGLRPSVRNGGELVEAGGQRPYAGSLQVRGMAGPILPSQHGSAADQDILVNNGRIGWLEEQLHIRDRLLAAAQVKEAQLLSEKRSLERRVAELRMAYDQQQQGMLEAASHALTYRKEVLDDNLRLTQAVERAEHDRAVFVATLMPLMAEFGLHPDASDAQDLVHSVKLVVQRLLAALSLERRVPSGLYNDSDHPPIGSLLAGLNFQDASAKVHLDQGQIITGGRRGHSNWPAGPGEVSSNGSREATGLENDVSRLALESGRRQSLTSETSPGPSYPQTAPTSAEPPRPQERRAWTDFVQTVHAGREPSEWIGVGESSGGQSVQGAAAFRGPNIEPPQPAHQPKVAAHEPAVTPSTNTNQQPTHRSPPEPEDPEPAGPELRPAIEGLRIVGDAVLGGKLTACGHSINGTALCVFQWVRQYGDGSAYYIDGAASPEYTITADDCSNIVAIECVPMDEMGNRGEKVRVVANDGHYIQLDAILQDKLEECLLDGGMSFDVNLLDGADTVPCVLQIKRLEYSLKRGSKKLFRGSFADEVQVEIQVGQPTSFIIHTGDGRQFCVDLRDSRQRDMAVLVMRRFKDANSQFPGNRKRGSWFR